MLKKWRKSELKQFTIIGFEAMKQTVESVYIHFYLNGVFVLAIPPFRRKACAVQLHGLSAN